MEKTSALEHVVLFSYPAWGRFSIISTMRLPIPILRPYATTMPYDCAAFANEINGGHLSRYTRFSCASMSRIRTQLCSPRRGAIKEFHSVSDHWISRLIASPLIFHRVIAFPVEPGSVENPILHKAFYAAYQKIAGGEPLICAVSSTEFTMPPPNFIIMDVSLTCEQMFDFSNMHS